MNGYPEEEVEAYRAAIDRTPIVSITDDAESETRYLRFMLIPERPILIGYHSATHERDSDLLLGRLASVLGYRVKLV